MKRIISCMLVVMMLIMAASAFAESDGIGRFGKSNALTKFIKATDAKTQDIALQVQSGDASADLVIRADGDKLHFVTRANGVEDGHVQFDPNGVYVSADGSVTLLRYATVSTVLSDISKEVDAMLEEAVKNLPEEKEPTKEEIAKAEKALQKAVNELAILASAAEAQEQADAATLSAAAVSFANKFKPEYILDVKEEGGRVQIDLRSEAYASALADAMDELMMNPALAELVDRQAALTGEKGFAAYQKQWAANREATLAAIRTMQSTDVIDENGHWVSHFQIGEEQSAIKILVCDTDSWIDPENGYADITATLGFKGEAPFLVYQLAVDQYAYHEKLSSGDSYTDVQMSFADGKISSGKVVTEIEGQEWMRAEVGEDYFYMKGQNGGISTSVRETWTGKTRYELVAESADGKEATVTVDFYEYGDSLVCELYTSESDQSATFKISRIDKLDIPDLNASEKIDEITAEKIEGELTNLLKSLTVTVK